MLTCTIAIGDQENWMVLQRPDPSEENDWILDWLHNDEYDQCVLDDDIENIKPGVYKVNYNPMDKAEPEGGCFLNFELLWELPKQKETE